jgi:hypothetical protein
MVYTTTYHVVGTVTEINYDALGVAWALLTDAKQVHEEKTAGQIVTSLDLGEIELPSTAVTGPGIRPLPAGATETRTAGPPRA